MLLFDSIAPPSSPATFGSGLVPLARPERSAVYFDSALDCYVDPISPADRAWYAEHVSFAAEAEAERLAEAMEEARYSTWLAEEARRRDAEYEARHFYGARV